MRHTVLVAWAARRDRRRGGTASGTKIRSSSSGRHRPFAGRHHCCPRGVRIRAHRVIPRRHRKDRGVVRRADEHTCLAPGSVAWPRRVSSQPSESPSLHSVGRSVVILTGAAAAIQVLGIVRELFLATQIGATANLDALLIAMILPTTLPSVLTSGAITALVPAYLQVRWADGHLEARRLAGAIVVWVGIGGAAIWVFLVAFAGVVIALTGPGLSDAARTEA